ncbi:MAG: hypothetical protein H0U49_02505 [Parachlamydiaceae bacterium]|nr:hypothetical protein [Parachlamydiaceae bacterium]
MQLYGNVDVRQVKLGFLWLVAGGIPLRINPFEKGLLFVLGERELEIGDRKAISIRNYNSAYKSLN